MEAKVEAVLSTLRDLPGVLGGFVLDAEGGVVARDLPRIVDDEALAEVGPRVGRLVEAVAAGGPPVTECVLAFGAHRLYVRPLEGGHLCVLSSTACPTAALRMAARLASKRIVVPPKGAMDVVVEVEEMPAPPAAPPKPPAAPPPIPAPARPRFFRGRRVDG